MNRHNNSFGRIAVRLSTGLIAVSELALLHFVSAETSGLPGILISSVRTDVGRERWRRNGLRKRTTR